MCIYCCFLVIRRKRSGRKRDGSETAVQLEDIASSNTAVGTDNLTYQNLASVQKPGKGRVFYFYFCNL